MLRMEDVLPWRAHRWEKSNIHTKPPESSAAAWGLPLGGIEQKWTPLRRCHHSAEKWLLRHFEFLFAKLKTISIPREVYKMATLPELTLLISTTFLLLPALRLMKKSRSSSRCFCVILEVLCVFFSIFFQCLTPYSVICSLAVATLFLNYLRNLRWHITMLQTQWKSTRGQRTNHNIHLMYQQLIPFTKNIANTLAKRDLTET